MESSPHDAMLEVLRQSEPELVALRRDLHAHPETGRAEVRTTGVLAERLTAAGIRSTRGRHTGLIAEIGSTDPDTTIALRADLDALPLQEETGLPWSSTVPGVSHACGHDVHTAALVGAGLALRAVEDELRERGIRARLLFQPAEELMPGGAQDLVAEGALEGVDEIYALHCDPAVDVGEVGLRVGAVTAATDLLEVTLRGSGGHTSRPHLTQDLTFALAKVVTEVPALLSRRVDPRAAASLVWGSVHAGSAPNVIPSTGTVTGTLRMLDASVWAEVGPLVQDLVHAVVAPYAVTAQVTFAQGVPPVVNDGTCIATMAAAGMGAALRVVPTPQSLGGEDFAWYLRHVPGAMARLGTRAPGGVTYDLHRGDLVVDERAVVLGAALLAGCVLPPADPAAELA